MVVEAWDAHTLPCRMSLNIFSRSARHVYLRTCRHFPPFFFLIFILFLFPPWAHVNEFWKENLLAWYANEKKIDSEIKFCNWNFKLFIFHNCLQEFFFLVVQLRFYAFLMHECPLTIRSFQKTVDTFVTNFRGVVNHICRSRSEWVKKCYLWSPLQKQRRELYK